ncbi:MAG: glycosyl hydrolase family 28-related protein [Planctomycetota bacterium]
MNQISYPTPRPARRATVLATAIATACIAPAAPAAGDESSLVYPGVSGRLLYASQADGDRVPDFSNVGYQSGEAAIPTIAQAIAVPLGPGDDTAAIQAAIDAVSAMPLNSEGFRGAVVLEAGEYQIGTQLRIAASGVVLRGAGDDAGTGTVIRATGTTQRSVILVDNATQSGSGSAFGTPGNITDKFVPVGARSFRVDNSADYTIGDRVLITRPGTQQWISDLGMDQIPPRSDGGTVNQWQPSSYDLTFERKITHIEGDRVFVDAPLTNALDQQYGGGTIQHFSFTNRLQNVGIEGLRGVSDYDTSDPTDEDHAWTFIQINRTEDGWVRDITGQHFGFSTVMLSNESRNVTVQDGHSIDPVSQVTGGRRYAFNISRAELNLMRDLTSDDGRHDFIFNSRSEGPNVFLNGVATNANSDVGPHQRWSTGGLFDNIDVTGDRINLRNRGNFGTGHGWAGANMVVWNSSADGFIVQSPPTTAQNWLIGSIGTIENETRFGQQPDGIVDQHGAQVDTPSLYLKQLEDRLAVANGTYRDYVLGDFDDYANDGPASADELPVSSDLLDEFGGYFDSQQHPLNGFDDTTNNQFLPHTWEYTIADDEQVYHAVVTFAMKRTGGRTRNDSVWYELFENRLRFEDLGLGDSEISNDESTMLMLEFTGTDLGWFNDGKFDVVIGEDVAVDWARLDLYVGDLLLGDMNADGVLNADDVAGFAAALDADGDPAQFTATQPIGRYVAGDFNADSVVSLQDYAGFRDALLTADPTAQATLDALVAGPAAGDFDLDGDIDADDIDLLVANYGNPDFDLTDDGATDAADLTELVENILGTYLGDANLDGAVDTADLAILAANFATSARGWSVGDFNGIAGVGTPDLAILASSFGSTSSPVIALVPEPAACSAVALAGAALLRRNAKAMHGPKPCKAFTRRHDKAATPPR